MMRGVDLLESDYSGRDVNPAQRQMDHIAMRARQRLAAMQEEAKQAQMNAELAPAQETYVSPYEQGALLESMRQPTSNPDVEAEMQRQQAGDQSNIRARQIARMLRERAIARSFNAGQMSPDAMQAALAESKASSDRNIKAGLDQYNAKRPTEMVPGGDQMQPSASRPPPRSNPQEMRRAALMKVQGRKVNR